METTICISLPHSILPPFLLTHSRARTKRTRADFEMIFTCFISPHILNIPPTEVVLQDPEPPSRSSKGTKPLLPRDPPLPKDRHSRQCHRSWDERQCRPYSSIAVSDSLLALENRASSTFWKPYLIYGSITIAHPDFSTCIKGNPSGREWPPKVSVTVGCRLKCFEYFLIPVPSALPFP